MIRDVGFLSWCQSNAWMESMTGTRWNNLVTKENARFKKELARVSTAEDLLKKTYEFEDAKKTIVFKVKNLNVLKCNNEYKWSSTNNKFSTCVSDLDTDGTYVYQLRDIEHGAQKYRLECIKDGHVVWYVDNLGDQLFLKDNKCYVLGTKNRLVYNSVCVVSNGSVEILYKELDDTFSLRFEKRGHQLFVIRYNGGYEELYILHSGLKRLSPLATSFYPIGVIKGSLCYFAYTDRWRAVGFDFPYKFQNMIEYVSLEDSILVLRHYGSKRVYSFKGRLKLINTFYGDLHINPWTLKLNDSYISTPEKGLVSYNVNDCGPSYATAKRYFAVSKDKRRIPYLVVRPACKIKGLMVVAYGAYGLATNVSTERWKPYLQDGWCIVFAMVRGSGDHTLSWASEARTINKIVSYYDLEACIKYAQKLLGLGPKQTCVYGRSAGGYLLGIAISQSGGSLFKMAYAEVPYVDVLSTTTNPKLPLTKVEYNEFGLPSRSIHEFQTILNLSPVDSLNYNTPPDISIVVRTSENDVQVYAYESLKWIESLRGKNIDDARKLVYITKNEGHFVKGLISSTHFAEDFFFLKSFRG